MVNLNQYICESARTTANNKERKEELEKYLKDKNYTDYVQTINKMLEDPKAASLLKDGFGGKLGNMKLTYSVKEIAAQALRPTQSELDLDKSLKHGLRKVDNLKNDFKEPVVINNMPLITFRGNYIIDGHHRWAEVAVINPEGKMTCFDYDGDISPIMMLKAVQGAIAAVIADKNKNNGDKLPSGKVNNETDMFNLDKEAIDKYVNSTITQEVCNELEKLVGTTSQEDSIQYIINRIIAVQNNNYPEKGMPARADMPQTDKGGTDITNKQSSLPDKNGSALNKLKKGKFDKEATV